MRKSLTGRWIEVLKKRQAEVAKVRDKLREDVSEMEALKESCEEAHDDLERAIDSLSKFA